jgi:two-component system, chemotaxis family, sensor kinase CheA
MSSEQNFNIRLLEVFHAEALQHRQAILSALRELENKANGEHEAEMCEKAFRAAHTLKGAAHAVNKSRIAGLCQSLESIFSILKKGQGRLGQEMFGALYEAMDTIENMEAGSEDGDSSLTSRLNDIRGALDG